MPIAIGLGIGPTRGLGGTGGVASIITSIQEVTVTIANSATTGDVTISSVDSTKAIIVRNGYTSSYTSGDNEARNAASIAFVNATTIRATRGVAPPSSVTVRLTVIEFKTAAIKSVQHGSITIASGDVTKDATITAVGDTTRTLVLWNGLDTTTTGRNITECQCGVQLVNSTTVRAYGSGTGGAAGVMGSTIAGHVNFTAIEFDPSAVDAVQQYGYRENTGSGNTSFSQSLSPSVDVTRSIVVPQGVICNSANGYQSHQFTHELQSNGASVTLTRAGTNVHDKTMYAAVVTFKTGVLAQAVQRGTISLGTGTSTTATIIDIGTTKSYANWCNPRGPAANDNDVFSDLARTNGTTLTATMQAANGSGGPIVAYEAVKFT